MEEIKHNCKPTIDMDVVEGDGDFAHANGGQRNFAATSCNMYVEYVT